MHAANESNDSKAGLHDFLCMTKPAVQTNLDWCSCANCCVMPSTHENACCCNIREELHSKMKTTFKCSSFKKICPDKDVLAVLVTAIKEAVAENLENEISMRHMKNYIIEAYL